MARAANQKLKCLYLWQFLLQNTDEEHPATIPQMIEYLAWHDIPAERKSLYDDIEALRQCGLDVEYRKAQGGGYYVASREFQLPELKLLVDAVQSSKFLSLRKSNVSSPSWKSWPAATRPRPCAARSMSPTGSRI